jgi:FdrA protein
MQLQKALIELPRVLDAANVDLLRQSGLVTDALPDARAEDLIIAVKAENDAAAQNALAQVDALLARRVSSSSEFLPRSVESATTMLPHADWALVSVPGRFAASVARDALALHRHVFLYSDNVPLDQEIELKQSAAQQGLLVMGPDCGTAIINGVGLGFANRVRRGRIGVVGASGTGIQAITARVHNLGAGISQAIGTGTRDLSDDVGAITTRQGLAILKDDPQTGVIVLVSKPPSPAVAQAVLRAARATQKPVVVDFIGHSARDEDNLHFAQTLSDAAEMAVALSKGEGVQRSKREKISLAPALPRAPAGFLRGLYGGGTLAYEAQLILREYCAPVYSNVPLDARFKLESPRVSREHSIVDLGAEEFMIGRLHPMIDNDLRIRRLRQEASDPNIAVILLDVVLGYGSHPNPSRELAPAITEARKRNIPVIAVVIGTDQDPQNLSAQVERLTQAGAHVEFDHARAVHIAGKIVQMQTPMASTTRGARDTKPADLPAISPIALEAFTRPFAGINVGLESFYESLQAQDAQVIHIDWRPPAGGNEKLMAILERLKK